MLGFLPQQYVFALAEALEKSQALGEEGDVDGSMAMAQQAENYKRSHENLHRQLTQPDRTMTVCDICGVFINSTDNEQRRLVSVGSGCDSTVVTDLRFLNKVHSRCCHIQPTWPPTLWLMFYTCLYITYW